MLWKLKGKVREHAYQPLKWPVGEGQVGFGQRDTEEGALKQRIKETEPESHVQSP